MARTRRGSSVLDTARQRLGVSNQLHLLRILAQHFRCGLRDGNHSVQHSLDTYNEKLAALDEMQKVLRRRKLLA